MTGKERRQVTLVLGSNVFRYRRTLHNGKIVFTFRECQNNGTYLSTKKEYFEHFGLPWPPTWPKLLTLDQGTFQMETRLKQLDLVLSGETEKDGSCMFDAIYDQIQHICVHILSLRTMLILTGS